MKTPILSQASTASALSNSATRYAAMASGRVSGFWGTSNAATQFILPYAGTISNLVGRMGNAVATGSYTVSVQKNGADVGSPITATISSGQTFSDTSTTMGVSAGDTVNYKIVPSSTPTPTSQTFVQMSCVFECATANRSVIFAVLGSSTAGSSVYVAPGAKCEASAESFATVPMPTAGVFESMYIQTQGSSPGVGNQIVFTLKVNGSSTPLTTTWSGTDSPSPITGKSVSVSAGDYVTIECASTGTTIGANISLGFQPTTDGESCQFSTISNNLGSSTVYMNANGRAPNNISTASDIYNVAPIDFTAKKLAVRLSASPATTATRTLTLYDNGSTMGVTAPVSSGSQTGSDPSNTFAVTSGDPIYLKHDFTGAPAAAAVGVGWVSYIAPSAGGSTHANLLLLGVG